MRTLKSLLSDDKKNISSASSSACTSLGPMNMADSCKINSLRYNPTRGSVTRKRSYPINNGLISDGLIQDKSISKINSLPKIYVSCSCGNNIECMLGMLANYSSLELKNWMKHDRNGFLATLSPNFITQAYYGLLMRGKLKQIKHIKRNPKFPIVGRRFSLGKGTYIKGRTRTGYYKPGLYKSILQASLYTGICINYLTYGAAFREHAGQPNWFLIANSPSDRVGKPPRRLFIRLRPCYCTPSCHIQYKVIPVKHLRGWHSVQPRHRSKLYAKFNPELYIAILQMNARIYG